MGLTFGFPMLKKRPFRYWRSFYESQIQTTLLPGFSPMPISDRSTTGRLQSQPAPFRSEIIHPSPEWMPPGLVSSDFPTVADLRMGHGSSFSTTVERPTEPSMLSKPTIRCGFRFGLLHAILIAPGLGAIARGTAFGVGGRRGTQTPCRSSSRDTNLSLLPRVLDRSASTACH